MNAAVKDPFAWSQKRFWLTVCVLVVVQVGLIFIFSDRTHTTPRATAPALQFHALGGSVSEDQLLGQFFVGDPAVFPLPNPRGFSGRGWMDHPPLTYQSEMPLETPIWLNIAPGQSNHPASISKLVSAFVSDLGTNVPVAPSSARPAFASTAEQHKQPDEPLPTFLTPRIAPTQSIFRIQGELAGRLLEKPALPSWPSDTLLNRSIVQIGVDPSGETVAARLETSCGLADADNEAIAKARALQFHSTNSGGTQWGRAIFQWQTVAPTNASPSK
jgi:hypothetical protein